jgi:hypothetical protein
LNVSNALLEVKIVNRCKQITNLRSLKAMKILSLRVSKVILIREKKASLRCKAILNQPRMPNRSQLVTKKKVNLISSSS